MNAEGAIGSLWLNRPERLNALSITLLQELAEAARWFDQQQEVRVVVVGGRGRAFSAGLDGHLAQAVATGKVPVCRVEHEQLATL